MRYADVADAALFFPLPQGRQVRVNIEQVVHLH